MCIRDRQFLDQVKFDEFVKKFKYRRKKIDQAKKNFMDQRQVIHFDVLGSIGGSPATDPRNFFLAADPKCFTSVYKYIKEFTEFQLINKKLAADPE